MAGDNSGPERYVESIRRRRLSIYHRIAIGDPELWIPTPELEQLLNAAMSGISLAGPSAANSLESRQGACLPVSGLPGSE